MISGLWERNDPMSQVTRRELAQGVWLRTVHTNKFKSSYLSVTFLVPLEEETASENALIPYVLRRGTAACPDLESLSARLDSCYGGSVEPVVRKKGETQCLGFVAGFLDDAYTLEGESVLEQAIPLVGELLLDPVTERGRFRSAYVKGERDNMVDRIRSQINDKRRYALMRLGSLMCQGEDYGVDRLGDEARTAAVTPDSLWQRYQELLRSAWVEVYYCGSAEPERVEQLLRRALAPLLEQEQRSFPACQVRAHGAQPPRYEVERMDVTQGKLALGFRTGGLTCWSPEFPALLLCNAVFGGSTLSKLFLNVREKLSLCYYASSMLEKMKGLVLVSSGIEFDKVDTAREEILAQLDAIRVGQVEDGELEGARRSLISAYRATLDSQSQLEEYWLGQAAAGMEVEPQQLAALLEGVTLEQVRQAAEKLELDTVYFLTGLEE